MEEIFSSFQPSDWTSVLLSIISLFLTVITLIVANDIPKALSKYRFDQELIKQLNDMMVSIGKARDHMYLFDDFLKFFDDVDSFFNTHKEYFSRKIQIKIFFLHRRHLMLLIATKDDNFKNTKKSYIRLLDDYKNLINYIRLQIGGKKDEKE